MEFFRTMPLTLGGWNRFRCGIPSWVLYTNCRAETFLLWAGCAGAQRGSSGGCARATRSYCGERHRCHDNTSQNKECPTGAGSGVSCDCRYSCQLNTIRLPADKSVQATSSRTLYSLTVHAEQIRFSSIHDYSILCTFSGAHVLAPFTSFVPGVPLWL